MAVKATSSAESLTRELASRLYGFTREYRPPWRERLQDWLIGQMAQDPALKICLLRFMDVLAALDFDTDGARVKRLFREYFGGPFPRSSPLLRLLLLAGRQRLAPRQMVARTARAAMQALASRFIVGPEVGAVLDTVAYLGQQGRYATFDLLGEEVLSEYEAEQFKARYLGLIDRLGSHPWSGRRTAAGAPVLQLSIKLSSLTENFNPADPEGTLWRCRRRLEEIVQHCAEHSIGLNIDAEHFAHRELTWHIFTGIFGPQSPFGQWDGAGITVQSYFRDADVYLWAVLEFARQRRVPFQVRLAKGAYWDYEVITARQSHWPVPVFEQKSETDQAFQRMLSTLLEHSHHVSLAVASHNIRDHAYAEAIRSELGLPPGAVEHQTLFRTAEAISQGIQRMGWESREYVPSGGLVPGMAYLVRRILENTAPTGFLWHLRRGEKAATLLQAPGEASNSGTQQSTGLTAPGFCNTPPKRLFLAGERELFESALETARAQFGREYPLELGGQHVRTREIKASLDPSLPDADHPVGLSCLAGVAEAQQAVSIARRGLARWSRTAAAERARILAGAADLLSQKRDILAAWIVHEGGRTWAEALADVDEAADHFAYNAWQLLVCQDLLETHYQPRGIVAVISPWNFPAALPAGMMSGALAAGNAVIIKSAEQTPVIATRLVEILHAAGVPEEVLVHLPGWGDVVGSYLVESPGVAMVAFTGSKAVGLTIVQKASAVRLDSGVKKVVAEMGGKNPIVVFPDADLDEAVHGILLSAFEHANQKCSACSRVFVHRLVFPRLRDRLVQAALSLPVGAAADPGTLVNPLIEPAARERVLAYARKAREEGEVLVDRLDPGSANPQQVGPLVVELKLANLSKSVIAREEIFGPILVIIPFADETEMLEQVNDTEYALTAGVFSRSPVTLARMVRAIRAGNMYVNRKITGARVGIEPFGGFQLSGTGPKAGSPEYLFAFVTRRPEDTAGSVSPSGTREGVFPQLAEKVTPWPAGVRQRRDVLRRCISLLRGRFHSSLLLAVARGYGVSPAEAEKMAQELLEAAAAVEAAAGEIAEPQATLAVPGQRNYTSWETPRGRGFVAISDETSARRLAGMLFGPLLAGNGLIVTVTPALQPLASELVQCLQRAGVPGTVIAMAPQGGAGAAVYLADDMFHFAVTDLGLSETQQVYERLGVTYVEKGQRWVKALISMRDGPQPGEPGFVRLFALPKTVAIRTLRHGADLDLPQVAD